MAQGIAWNKKTVFEALEPKLKLGYSLTKACNICVIPISTVSTWLEKDEALRLKVNSWQNEISDMARINWSEAIKNGVPTKYGQDTYNPSKDWLERKSKDEFSVRQEITGQEGEAIAVKFVDEDFKGSNE
jgi:hypothetical protein